MNDKMALNEDLLKTIAGGVLPEGWEREIDQIISVWKNTSDKTLIQWGYQPGKEGLIEYYRINGDYQRGDRAKDLETVIDYIDKNY